MVSRHVVHQGGTFASIAAAHGLLPETIWIERDQITEAGHEDSLKAGKSQVIELVDEADEPVVGGDYLVTLPDGSVATGPDGVARIEGVEPRSCKICSPQLDQDAWEKI